MDAVERECSCGCTASSCRLNDPSGAVSHICASVHFPLALSHCVLLSNTSAIGLTHSLWLCTLGAYLGTSEARDERCHMVICQHSASPSFFSPRATRGPCLYPAYSTTDTCQAWSRLQTVCREHVNVGFVQPGLAAAWRTTPGSAPGSSTNADFPPTGGVYTPSVGVRWLCWAPRMSRTRSPAPMRHSWRDRQCQAIPCVGVPVTTQG